MIAEREIEVESFHIGDSSVAVVLVVRGTDKATRMVYKLRYFTRDRMSGYHDVEIGADDALILSTLARHHS